MTTVYENKCMYYEKSHRAKNPALPRIISDHLGSIRVVLNEQGNVDSWSDYYPFGKESRGSSTNNEPKEQFTGKERDIEIGLDYFGARYYNADIGRWTSRDPLSGKYPSLSPYNYTANNPIIFIDPNGKDIWVAGNLQNSQSFKDAVNLALSTQLGKELANKLINDHNILVAFVGDNLDRTGNKGELYFLNDQKVTFEIVLSDGSKVPYKNSKGQFVFIVKLHDEYLSKQGELEYSKTVFHEAKAHVETKPVKNENGKKKMSRKIGSDEDEHKYFEENYKDEYEKQAKEVLKRNEEKAKSK